MFSQRILLALAILTLPACRVTDMRLWSPSKPPTAADALAVKKIDNIAYFEGKDADDYRHRLDLYIPQGKKDFPVVVLVHGGSWMMGDNRCCGLYSSVGEFLASRGIGAVLPNYRLTPTVKHPEHMKDLAKAVAWTKAHIAEHGGRPDKIFLAGHSAGGHMVALLATDDQYLKAEGLAIADIKGVIALSGVYRIPEGNYQFNLFGSGKDGMRIGVMGPLRGDGGTGLLPGTGIPMSVNAFGPVFGDDPKARADASPVNHIRAGLPPFTLFSAENDLPGLPAMADEFQQALVQKGCPCQLHKIAARNHNSIMFRAIDMEDPVGKAIVEAIQGAAR